jgi:ABC-2 type transport system ATP-binding protein
MAIAVRDLTKFYGSEKAVDNISFDVQSGEILGFLGPNGAGKTTTMKIVTCYLPPTSGEVTVDGLKIAEHSLEVRRKIGYLPEHNPLYLEMNVLEYLTYAGDLHTMAPAHLRSRLKEMVELCGLGDVRHKDIGELSKGYRQRVGLAQAMIHDPQVLILDEPTSGLDPNQIVEIRSLIRQLGRQKTVIFSTHILSEVQATCDRVVIINDGRIVADGTPEQLQSQFRGSEIITLELRASTTNAMADLHPVFAGLRDIESATYVPSDGPTHRFVLHAAKGSDVREEIFQLAVRRGWVLLELSRQATSLEEVFHRLTRTDEVAA